MFTPQLFSASTDAKAIRLPQLSFKTRSLVVAAIMLLMLSFSTGCEKETIVEPTVTYGMQADIWNSIQTPSNPCATPVNVPIESGAAVLGNASLQNDPSDFYLNINLNNYRFLEEIYVYTAGSGPLPLNNDGDLELEEFPYHYVLNQSSSQFTLTIPNGRMQSCGSVIVWARISTKNVFGQVTATTTAWMSGTAIANGFETNFCLTNC